MCGFLRMRIAKPNGQGKWPKHCLKIRNYSLILTQINLMDPEPNIKEKNTGRQSFRIEDDLIVGVYLAKSNESSLSKTEIIKRLFSASEIKKMHLYEEFQNISDKFKQLSIRKGMQNFSDNLRLINEKIDLIATSIFIEETPNYEKINISSSGIGIYLSEKFDYNTIIYLRLTFPPRYNTLFLRTRVVNVIYHDHKATKAFLTGLKYENLSDKNEQFLNQYILKVQINSRSFAQDR